MCFFVAIAVAFSVSVAVVVVVDVDVDVDVVNITNEMFTFELNFSFGEQFWIEGTQTDYILNWGY